MSSAENEKEHTESADSEESVEVLVEETAPEDAGAVEEQETPAGELEKWKDVAARAQADLDNFRKRMAREKSEAILYANRSLLEQLLPIIDNFEMGLKAARDGEGESSMIFQGMAMVFKQIEEFLRDQGVEVIESDGKPFDPNVHDAIKQEPSDTVPENTVLFTMRRGYRLKDRVIRAASVIVSSGPSKEE